jgi:hypothetical protein
MIFAIAIPELNVAGVKTKKALLDKEIVGRKIEIKEPVIDLHYTFRGKDSTRKVPTEEIYREVLGNLDMIQFDSVVISRAHLRARNQTGKLLIDIRNVDLDLLDVRVDSIGSIDSGRLFFAKDFRLNVSKLAWPSPEKYYDYIFENISLGSARHELKVSHAYIKPRLGENAFVNALPTQDDRFDFSFHNVRFGSVNIRTLTNEYLKAESMTIGNSSLKIYRDLARPRDKKNRVGYYPHQVLDDIPFKFNIKKIIVNNSYVEYKERNHITRQSGRVQLHNVNGSITNFTNDKHVTDRIMRARITSNFLGSTPLKTNWTFYLFDPGGRFEVSGNAGSINGSALNPLIEPMGPAHIKEGELNSLTFDFDGNDYSMNGTVKMTYNDLKVDLLEKDKGATETDKKFLTSLMANIVIKNDNPKDGDEVRVEKVYLDRNTNRSLFNLCWKTLFKGIRQTVGIKREMAVK